MKDKALFKKFELTEQESKSLKGGYIDINNSGTGSNGFINWDDIDPRGNGFVYLPSVDSVGLAKLGKK